MKYPLSFFLLLSLFYPSISSTNQIHEYQKAEEYLTQRNELYFTFWIDDLSVIDELTNLLSIDEIKGNEITAYANREQFEKFLSYCLYYEVKMPPGLLYQPEMSDYTDTQGDILIDKYPTYQGYLDLLDKFQNDNPNICEVEEIGKSVNNRKLMLVKLSDNVQIDEAEPKFYSTGSIHGDETEGFVLMLKTINYLCSNYNNDEQATRILDNIQVFFTPLINPDGLYAGGDNTVYGARRTNANNCDLNRSFPCKCGMVPRAEPETKAVMKVAEENITIVNYIDFHGGIQALLYPWSCTNTAVADEDWWKHIMNAYCKTANDAAGQNYMEYYRAYNLYNTPTHGTTKDYWTYHRPSRGCTMELWNLKTMAENEFERFFNYNLQAFLDYIEQTRFGIRGIVTDTFTNKPIQSNVEIVGHDKDNSFFMADPKAGDYYRPISNGTYTVKFSHIDYHSKTISNVKVFNDSATFLDVTMKPLVTDITEKLLLHSPSNIVTRNSNSLIITIPKSLSISKVAIFDVRGRKVITLSRNSLENHIFWDGKNHSGVPVSRGFYFIELFGKSGNYISKYLL